MNPLIRILFALLFLCLALTNGFAGDGSVKPLRQTSAAFRLTIQRLDSISSVGFAVSEELQAAAASASSGHICSCQILNLESANYNHQYVALLAEKTNHGIASDFSLAKKRIDREKKNLKRQFYDKVKVVNEVSGVGSCQALYARLKGRNQRLQIYEILNADIR